MLKKELMEGQEGTLLQDKERGIRSQLLRFWSGILGLSS